MSRSTAFLGTLAAVSLIANAWQYLHRGAADAPPTGALAVPHDAATAAPTPAAGPRPSGVAVKTSGSAAPDRSATNPIAATAPRRTPEECARLAHEQRVARLRDPVQREAIRRLERSNARQLMAAVGSDSGLDRPTLDRIGELEAEYTLQQMEADEPRRPADDDSAPLNPLIQGELGIDVARKWSAYQQKQRDTALLEEFSSPMANADTPLNAAQREQLLATLKEALRRTLAQTRSLLASRAPTTGEYPVARLESAYRQAADQSEYVIHAAAGYLNPAQIRILEEQYALRTQLSEALSEASPPEGITMKVQYDTNGCPMLIAVAGE